MVLNVRRLTNQLEIALWQAAISAMKESPYAVQVLRSGYEIWAKYTNLPESTKLVVVGGLGFSFGLVIGLVKGLLLL